MFTSLGGYPETSADIFFFGSSHTLVVAATSLGSVLFLQTLPLMLRCTGARYYALGTDRRPAAVLCLGTELYKVSRVAPLSLFPFTVCFQFSEFSLSLSPLHLKIQV